MAELRRFIRHVGEWVEVEPRGLFERIKGSRKADERDQELQAVLESLRRESEFWRQYAEHRRGGN